jgi:hypothetical protein
LSVVVFDEIGFVGNEADDDVLVGELTDLVEPVS